MANKSFQELLIEQKGEQEKEQVAISEAAQTFTTQKQLEVTRKYANQLKGVDPATGKKVKPTISREAQSVVANFSQELDSMADGSFSEFKDVMDKYQTLVGKLDESRRFNNDERKYIGEIIAPVLSEVRPLANAFTATRMGFKDLMKQFKPLKLAARVFGNIPILGTAIEKKIERTEAGERELRSAEVQKGKAAGRAQRKAIAADTVMEEIHGEDLAEGDLTFDELDEQPIVRKPRRTQREEEREELASRRVAPFDSKPGKGAAGEEAKEEQLAIQEGWHEEDKNLFETIAENTEQTNILMEDFIKSGGGEGDGFMGTAAKAVGYGTAGTAAVGGTALAAKKLMRKKPKVKTPSTLSSKAKTLAKGTVKTGAKVASTAGRVLKGAARVGGRLFLPLAAGLAIFDAATSVAKAGEILGKEKEDLTLRDKAAVGTGGLLEGLTFGFLKKEKIAKFLAGDPSEQDKAEKIAPVKSDTKPLIYGADNVAIDSKNTSVRAHLETSSLENAIEKLFNNNKDNNGPIIPVSANTINNANSTNVWPDMSNVNIDTTINNIKTVY